MSGDVPFQYVPRDKLKIYRNHVLINSILRKLNFSTKFSLTEVSGTDSVDIDTSLSSLDGELNDLSDVVVSSPAIDQFFRYNGTNWNNETVSIPSVLDDLSDVDIVSPLVKHVLRHDGTSFKNVQLTLNDLSGVLVSGAPISGDHLVHNGTNWVNQAPTIAATREELAAQFGMMATEDLGASYIDAVWVGVTGPGGFSNEGTKAITNIDFTGKTQYKIVLALVVEGGIVTPDVKIVDDANPAVNTLHEFLDITQGTQITSLTSLPAWATGVQTLRMQYGGGDGVANVYIPSCSVYLK